ncbi:MAG: hydroxyacylglutathione hydrolase [Pseudomonadota bacterium]
MVDIHIIPILSDNYSYILISDDVSAIVDPGDAEPIIDFCEQKNLKPSYIVNTHHHWDHTDGNKAVKDHYNCKIVAPFNEQDKIDDIDISLKDGEIFQFGNTECLAVETKGHTQGHLCYWFEKENFLLAGDQIFAFGCGRPIEGSAKDLYESFQKFDFLKPDSKIYCGHEYTLTNAQFVLSLFPNHSDIFSRYEQMTKLREKGKPTIPFTWEEEQKTNPFCLAKDLEEFELFRKKRNSF